MKINVYAYTKFISKLLTFFSTQNQHFHIFFYGMPCSVNSFSKFFIFSIFVACVCIGPLTQVTHIQSISHSYAECAFFTLLSLIFIIVVRYLFSSILFLRSFVCLRLPEFFFCLFSLLPSCRLNDSFRNVSPSFVYKIKNGCFIARQPFAIQEILTTI